MNLPRLEPAWPQATVPLSASAMIAPPAIRRGRICRREESSRPYDALQLCCIQQSLLATDLSTISANPRDFAARAAVNRMQAARAARMRSAQHYT